MSHPSNGFKVGVFIDVANIYMNGGQRMQYDVLREFACRDGSEPMRLNAYVTYDADRASDDEEYRKGAMNFHAALRDIGYKVIIKEIHWYIDENGNRIAKANSDLDLAVDAMLQSEKLDRIVLASGDGDFVQLIRAVQNKGCRVEVIGLDNVSTRLKQEADLFLSGFLIPNLIPVDYDGMYEQPPVWGEVGSRVRGWCYWHSDQGYGFLRYIKKISPALWVTDTRHPESPYGTVFFHDSNLPSSVNPAHLPSRSYILEFELGKSDRGSGIQAMEIDLASRS
ncbi:MAG TPA: NYN domain-containing protein [Anaerolinea sp.]|nr:NYN domain-containing protein [Anaerolinea sp.]